MSDRVPLDVRRRLPTRIRYLFDEDDDGHWIWSGRLDSDGYGRVSGEMAHRRIWRELVGPVPEGSDLDHRPSCPRRCVRPDHLTPKPKAINRRWERPAPLPKGQMGLDLGPVEPPRTRKRWD